MLFKKIAPKKIQAQNLSNCSQNIVKITIRSLRTIRLKFKEPSKFIPTPKKTDN